MSYNKSKKLSDNIAAIRTVLRLAKEGRQANSDECAVLRKYSGFGGLKFILNPVGTDADIRFWKASDRSYFGQTRELFAQIHENAADEDEEQKIVSSVKRSVNTAFYTPIPVIDGLVKALKATGIEVRTLLDPSAGIGKFGDAFKAGFGGVKVTSYEKDLLTGYILQALNKDDAVTIDGFETIPSRLKGTFDVVSSNIPFGDIKIFDPEFRSSGNAVRRSATNAIHNYFFLKSLDMVRDGGFVAFITSRGVMDSSTSPVRREMLSNASLVTALRLPDGMFRDEAGTDVGSDLVILQKNVGKQSLTPQEEDFVRTVETSDGIVHNGYFDTNKSHILTTGAFVGTDPYGKPAYVYPYDDSIFRLSQQIYEQVSADLTQTFSDAYYASTAPVAEPVREEPVVQAPVPQAIQTQHVESKRPSRHPKSQDAHSAPVQLDLFSVWDAQEVVPPKEEQRLQQSDNNDSQDVRPATVIKMPSLDPRPYTGEILGHYRDGIVIEDKDNGQLGSLSHGIFTPITSLGADNEGRMRQYILVRDAYEALYSTESDTRKEQLDLREDLNRHYDNFVLKYGYLNERRNMRVIEMDIKGRDVLTLENPNPADRSFSKADIFERPVSFIAYNIEHVDSPEEALSSSLNRYGTVNLEYMSNITGHSPEELADLLKGSIYYLPNGRYAIASKVLSGNVYEKLEHITNSLAFIEKTSENRAVVSALQETKAALEQSIPQQIPFDDIGLQFGER